MLRREPFHCLDHPPSPTLMKDWVKEEAKDEVKDEPYSDDVKEKQESEEELLRRLREESESTPDEVRAMRPLTTPPRRPRAEPNSGAGTESALPVVPFTGSVAALGSHFPNVVSVRSWHSDIRNRDPPGARTGGIHRAGTTPM